MKVTDGSLVVTDVSFSSYLKPPDQEAISSQEHPANSADTELGIFDARKYFNEGVADCNDQATTLSNSKRVSPIKDGNLNHPSDPSFFPRFSSASSTDGYGYRNRSLASSEVSWNSHTGLLGPSSDHLQRDNNRGGVSSRKNKVPRWLLFHSKCPCSGKNSVRVKENSSMKKEAEAANPNNPNPNREKTMAADQRNHFRVSLNMMDSRHVLVSAPPKKPLIDATSVTVTATSSGFTFPILNAPPRSSSPPLMKTLDDRKIRASPTVLDVPKDIDGEAKKMNGSTSTVDVENDDAASDASSDLFEIESITTQSTYPITTHHHCQRDSLGEAILPRIDLPLPSNCVAVDGKKLLVAGNHRIEPSNVRRIMTIVPEGAKFGPKIGNDYHSLLSAPEFERFPRIDLGRSARVIIDSAECDGDSRPRGSGLLSCRT